MARPLPTTKAQVSGHKFLRRRVEHGLVLGDIRMIHDPLARRRKALLFGGVGIAFLAVGSGMLAWLQPSPQPGDAPIVRSKQGQLFVDVNDTYHPVFNLASARIIAGQAAEAQAIGDEHLHDALLGSPVGIADARGTLRLPARLRSSAGRPVWQVKRSPQGRKTRLASAATRLLHKRSSCLPSPTRKA